MPWNFPGDKSQAVAAHVLFPLCDVMASEWRSIIYLSLILCGLLRKLKASKVQHCDASIDVEVSRLVNGAGKFESFKFLKTVKLSNICFDGGKFPEILFPLLLVNVNKPVRLIAEMTQKPRNAFSSRLSGATDSLTRR